MTVRYRTSASNADGATGVSAVPHGLSVRVASPLSPAVDPDATNPEQLLALAWATCLNATLQAIIGARHRTRVRVDVRLREAPDIGGYEFDVVAVVAAEGLDAASTRELASAAHARCPVSRLLRGARTVGLETEEYSA